MLEDGFAFNQRVGKRSSIFVLTCGVTCDVAHGPFELNVEVEISEKVLLNRPCTL